MAFDWSKLEGYREDMTVEEKLALLDNFEPNPEPAKGFISKAQFDKVSGELAEMKKKLRAKMSEDEQKEADRLAKEQKMQEELETLRKDKSVSTYKASFLAQGYDEALATEAATAMADGDMESAFATMKKHSENAEKALRAKIMKETPVPPAGTNLDEKSEGVKLAESVGKAAVEANKTASEVLSHYI